MLEFVLEILLNGVGELLVELLGRSKADEHPVGRAVIWLLVGIGFGWLSTLVFPAHFIHSERLQLVNLAAGPLFVGTVSGLVASARQKPVAAAAVSAALFSLAFAVVRWKLAA